MPYESPKQAFDDAGLAAAEALDDFMSAQDALFNAYADFIDALEDHIQELESSI